MKRLLLKWIIVDVVNKLNILIKFGDFEYIIENFDIVVLIEMYYNFIENI